MTVEDYTVERICPRCQYPISPGFKHVTQVQPEGASHVVCSLERAGPGLAMPGPLVETIVLYLDKAGRTKATSEELATWLDGVKELEAVEPGWLRTDDGWVRLPAHHVIAVTKTGWAIEHSWRCRVKGRLLTCALDQFMRGQVNDLLSPGRWRVTWEGEGDLPDPETWTREPDRV